MLNSFFSWLSVRLCVSLWLCLPGSFGGAYAGGLRRLPDVWWRDGQFCWFGGVGPVSDLGWRCAWELVACGFRPLPGQAGRWHGGGYGLVSSALVQFFGWAEDLLGLGCYESAYLEGRGGWPEFDGTCVCLPHGWYSVRGLSLRQRLALWCSLCMCLSYQCSSWHWVRVGLAEGVKSFGSCLFRGWFRGLSF